MLIIKLLFFFLDYISISLYLEFNQPNPEVLIFLIIIILTSLIVAKDLKKVVKKAIKKVNKESYFNIIKYAYGTKEIRHSVINISSRRRSAKKYKS